MKETSAMGFRGTKTSCDEKKGKNYMADENREKQIPRDKEDKDNVYGNEGIKTEKAEKQGINGERDVDNEVTLTQMKKGKK